MKKLILFIILCVPMFAMAQQLKMHIRAFGGVNTSTFVYRVEGLDNDILAGWQAGAGFRISHRHVFVESDIVYVNHGITVNPGEDVTIDVDEPIDIRMKALEIPITMGWIPVKKALFKWYLYGGLANRFSLKGKYEYKGEEDNFKPSELGLHFYNLGVRFGTQVDLAMFNFDFHYTIGVTNGFKNRVRTNTHGLQLTMGFVF